MGAHEDEMSNEKHIGKYIERAGHLDQWKCSCGWSSNSYFDGAAWAEAEWKAHTLVRKQDGASDSTVRRVVSNGNSEIWDAIIAART